MIPDFKDGQGAVIIKAHHVFSDGLGFATFFLALSNVYDKNALPALKPLSFLKQALIYLLLPFLILRISLVILFTFKNNNIIKRRQQMTGKKNGAFCQDYDLDAIKAYCKGHSCTINDFMTANLSVTLYQYF